MKLSLSFVISILCVKKFCNCLEEANSIDVNISSQQTESKPLWKETDVDRLRKDLLANYDKFSIPMTPYKPTITLTNVYVDNSIIYLLIDELNSTVTISSMFQMHWHDTKLRWNKDDYNGIEQVRMSGHQIWKPDIILYNGIILGSETEPQLIVPSYGVVRWRIPSRFKAFCAFDLYYWPFDTQHCYLKFVLRINSGKEMRLALTFGLRDGGKYKQPLHKAISHWEIEMLGEEYNKHYICGPHPLSTVQFDLILTRQWSSYGMIIIIPILAVIGLTLMQLSLPCNSTQRFVLNCCTLLIITILLSYFTLKVPAMGNSTPWIIVFYTTCLYMVSISMVGSIFVSLLRNSEHKQPLPGIIREKLRGKLGKLLFLERHVLEFYTAIQHHTEEEVNDSYSTEHEGDRKIKSEPKGSTQREWEIFAIAVDRAVLYIYSFIFVVLLLCYVI